jgi:signal peptidase I
MRPSPVSPVRSSPRDGPATPGARRRVGLQLVAVALIALAVVVVRLTVVAPVRIASESMLPTLDVGDVVLVTQASPGAADLERGDLVLFRSPADGRPTLKRVMGLPGDVLVIKDGRLYVNSRLVEEPYVDHEVIDGYYSRSHRVPTDTVFVLGDNRGNSIDSRDYGSVATSLIQGRVLARVWPFG